MIRFALSLLLCLASASGQTAFYPLRDVRPGQRGVGRTVFHGEQVEEFQVEILGVLENMGPKQSIILARLSGGPLAQTGVMQGMSGSPVYIDGKLVGAVALGFPFSKETIAGIRPIDQMVTGPARDTTPPAPSATAHLAAPLAWTPELVTRLLPRREDSAASDPKLIDIATPLSFGGFTAATLDHFAPTLRALGLEPRQALSGGGVPRTQSSNPAEIKPGSMISVQLVTGDMTIGADGTVTYVDGRRVYAFGHQFLSTGQTELPFARSSVIALLPNLNSSFKISSAQEWLGSITEDRVTAVSGEVGRRPQLVPINLRVTGPLVPAGTQYRAQMVNDRALSPFLLQMVVYSAIEATQRSFGSSSFRLKGTLSLGSGLPPIQVDNVFTGDFNVPLQASLAAALPLSYLLQSSFDTLKLQSIDLAVEATNGKRQYQIDQVYASRREVRPGESLDIATVLIGENGREVTHHVSYNVPVGAPAGPLYITVGDANTLNLTDYSVLSSSTARTPRQTIAMINAVRSSRKGYVRFWRAEPSFPVQSDVFTDPPASLALILAKTSAGVGGSATQTARVAEVEFSLGDVAITGSKTIQVEVKE